jgi:large subunit ribosomal protein L9
MEIILLEQVEKLGSIGKTINVKNGYARNYLIPEGKALPATKANKELFEAQKAEIEKRNKENQAVAEKDAKAVEGKFFVIIRHAGDDGRLHGSVNGRDIANKVAEVSGVEVAKTAISLEQAIKVLGVYPAKVKLHADVAPVGYVIVARSEEEAKEAKKKFLAGSEEEKTEVVETKSEAAEDGDEKASEDAA